jgi:hypothetical protein
MTRVPLHARTAAIAQTILGPACADVDVVLPSEVPPDDGREFFVVAWCLHPRFIPNEKIIFIPEPHVLDPVVETEVPGLRYLVRIRLVAFQNWNTPPASPRRGDHGGVGVGWMMMTVLMTVTTTAAIQVWMAATAACYVDRFQAMMLMGVALMMMVTPGTVTATGTTPEWTPCSLFGRHVDCSDEPGFLGRLLLEDHSLLVGPLDCSSPV